MKVEFKILVWRERQTALLTMSNRPRVAEIHYWYKTDWRISDFKGSRPDRHNFSKYVVPVAGKLKAHYIDYRCV